MKETGTPKPQKRTESRFGGEGRRMTSSGEESLDISLRGLSRKTRPTRGPLQKLIKKSTKTLKADNELKRLDLGGRTNRVTPKEKKELGLK